MIFNVSYLDSSSLNIRCEADSTWNSYDLPVLNWGLFLTMTSQPTEVAILSIPAFMIPIGKLMLGLPSLSSAWTGCKDIAKGLKRFKITVCTGENLISLSAKNST